MPKERPREDKKAKERSAPGYGNRICLIIANLLMAGGRRIEGGLNEVKMESGFRG
jgi:hypothetical protein